MNKRYRLKIAQAYAPTASYHDEAVDSFYKDMKSAVMETTKFTIVLGNFNEKVGETQMEKRKTT